MTFEPLKQGVHPNIPAADYHSDELTEVPALTAGMAVELIGGGPARAWVRKQEPPKSAAMEFGVMAHIAILEPHLLETLVVIVDADDWRSKAAREEKEAALSACKHPILAKDFEKFEAMAMAMRNELDVPFDTIDASLVGILEGGNAEVTLIADDRHDGIWLKARADYLKPGQEQDIIIDYKTTGLRGDSVEREAERRRYDLRAAHYLETYKRATGRSARYRYLIQESNWPHFVFAYDVPSILLRQGRADAESARVTWRQCISSGTWQSDVNGVRVLDLYDIGEITA